MRVMPLSTFRKDISNIISELTIDHDIAIVTRESSAPAVVMSLDEYNSWLETLYLFSSEENAKRVMQGMEEVETMIARDKEKKRKSNGSRI